MSPGSDELVVSGYAQLCPVAKAASVLDQRWTLLVLRELLAGSTRFNEIHRGVPRMSRSLLAKRLGQLASAGVVDRRPADHGPVYHLTRAGEDLAPVLEAIGAWGSRWMPTGSDEDDPALLLRDLLRGVDPEQIPGRRAVIAFRFPDARTGARRWWMVVHDAQVDVRNDDPGLGTDVWLTGSIRTLREVWRGDRRWRDAVGPGGIHVHGHAALCRRLPGWIGA